MPERLAGYRDLLDVVKARITRVELPLIVAVAGPPATGKSTLAERLTDDLKSAGHSAAYCPMDGFHKTNVQLENEGLRAAKGRIDTFDAAGFARAVARLANGDAFWWPRYSRHLHDPVPEGTRIEGTERVCVIEGNYVLSPIEPWASAAAHFDLSVFLDAPDDLLTGRLARRHEAGGKDRLQIQTKITGTDLPNAAAIRETARSADYLFEVGAHA